MLQYSRMSKTTDDALTRTEITTRIRDRVLAARDDIVGLVVFGSFARGSQWHDVDVLIIVETSSYSTQDYSGQVAALQRALGWPPSFDVLLLPFDSFALNLTNHTPLFLDIAFDGEVLYDSGGVAQALETTRAEVLEHGIQRTASGGWRFPVRYRESTRLSPSENQDWAQAWLNEAVEDSQSANSLLEDAHFARCVYLSQQAVEKSVKAVLACFGTFERAHYVAQMLEAELAQQSVGDWKQELSALAEISARHEPHVARTRYPGLVAGEIWEPAKEYQQEQAAEAVEDARKSVTTARNFILWWFIPTEDTEEPK